MLANLARSQYDTFGQDSGGGGGHLFSSPNAAVVVESWHSEVVHVSRSAGFQGFGGGHQGFRQGAGRYFPPFTRVHHVARLLHLQYTAPNLIGARRRPLVAGFSQYEADEVHPACRAHPLCRRFSHYSYARRRQVFREFFGGRDFGQVGPTPD